MRSVQAEVSPLRSYPGILVTAPAGDVLRRLGTSVKNGRVTMVTPSCMGEEFGIESDMCCRVLDGHHTGAFFFSEPTSATTLMLTVCEACESSSQPKLLISGATIGGTEVFSHSLPVDSSVGELAAALQKDLYWPRLTLLSSEGDEVGSHCPLKRLSMLIARRCDGMERCQFHRNVHEHMQRDMPEEERLISSFDAWEEECLACSFDARYEDHKHEHTCQHNWQDGHLGTHKFRVLHNL